MKAVNKASFDQPGAKKWAEKPSLFFKFTGDEAQIKHDISETAKVVKSNRGDTLIFAKNEQEKEDLWRARKVGLWSSVIFHV